MSIFTRFGGHTTREAAFKQGADAVVALFAATGVTLEAAQVATKRKIDALGKEIDLLRQRAAEKEEAASKAMLEAAAAHEAADGHEAYIDYLNIVLCQTGAVAMDYVDGEGIN